jgi:hypothetical protein
MSSCSFRAHGNVIKRARKSPTISIRTLQDPRSRLFEVMKIMGCLARGWGWPVENFNNRISNVMRLSDELPFSAFLLWSQDLKMIRKEETRTPLGPQSDRAREPPIRHPKSVPRDEAPSTAPPFDSPLPKTTVEDHKSTRWWVGGSHCRVSCRVRMLHR